MQEFENIQKDIKIKPDDKVGIFIGRCMPFHNGHSAIIQDIIRDGRTPIIVLGGKGKKDKRHPLSFDERVHLIRKVYSMGCKFIGIEDQDNWNNWYDSVKEELNKITPNMNQFVLYAHEKEMDKKSFSYRGKDYNDASYVDMFRDNNIQIKEMSAVECNGGLVIHASKVREDEEYAKLNLDARVYIYLKNNLGWWK